MTKEGCSILNACCGDLFIDKCGKVWEVKSLMGRKFAVSSLGKVSLEFLYHNKDMFFFIPSCGNK